MNFSVVIISRKDEQEKVDACLESIRNAAGGNFEIEVIVVYDEKETGKLGNLRNQGIQQAKNDIIITLDNDILLLPDFFVGILEYCHWDKWQIMSCRLLNPDWTRHWDWKGITPAGNYLNHYMTGHDPKQSLTGGLVIAKREVYDNVLWDEERGFYEDEDVEFSERIKQHYQIKFNPYSSAIHNDPTYHRIFGTTGVQKI